MYLKRLLFCVICIWFVFVIFMYKCYADDYINQYDFSEADSVLKEETGYGISFKKLINDIVGTDIKDMDISKYASLTLEIFRANKDAVLQIFVIGILSAVLRIFSDGIGSKQLTGSSQLIISITLITILIAVFSGAVRTVSDVLLAVVNFYQSICPVFFPAVMAVGGNVSAAAYYQIVTMMIGGVNIIFKNVLIKIDAFFMLLGVVDSVTEEEHFSKACELMNGIIKYVSRSVLIFFLGLNGIKGMIAPFIDSYKNNILCKALSVIPGIGNTAVAVSKTMLGAGVIVKNSIGAATILAIILISIIPVLKLAVLVTLYKIVAAVIEPIAGRNVVGAVNMCSKAIANLLQILLVTVALLILTIGIICLTTNVSYGA